MTGLKIMDDNIYIHIMIYCPISSVGAIEK